MTQAVLAAKTDIRTLTFDIQDAPPTKYDYVYWNVTGVKVTYTDYEVTEIRIMATPEDGRDEDGFLYRIDLPRDMWQPWVREIVEKHQPSWRQ